MEITQIAFNFYFYIQNSGITLPFSKIKNRKQTNAPIRWESFTTPAGVSTPFRTTPINVEPNYETGSVVVTTTWNCFYHRYCDCGNDFFL